MQNNLKIFCLMLLRKDWLIPLEEKIEVVNKTFAGMFAEVGCAGEVKLLKNEVSP